MNFNFGSSSSPKAVGFALPTTATTTSVSTATAGVFSLGGGDAAAKLSQASTAELTPAAPQTTAIAGQQSSLAITTSAAAATTAAATTSGFTLGGSGSVGFTLSTPATGFSLTPSTTATTATTTVAATTAASTAGQSVLATGTIVSSAPTGTSISQLNFCQLEENINKWKLELEEQEKVFMNQATQVNAWDRLLIGNGEKIVSLNNAVERVKLEQQQLDNELDFILSQQRELEECLTSLAKELSSTVVTDPEREHIYQLAENLDTQLKQMSEDLKEIIEHLNETNSAQDSSDPIVQIGRILNAHMNSLQWIDQNTSVISNHLDQVSKLHDVHRRENERSFHLTYN